MGLRIQGGKAISRTVTAAILAVSSMVAAHGKGAELSPLPSAHSTRYYWQTQPVGNSAQLVTLFCNSCGNGSLPVPLVSVLRDTLGDDRPENDRLTYVWLLGLTHQSVGQRMLAAVPFFYWRVGDGSTHIDENHRVAPLMDLTKPEQPMAVQAVRQIVQWTVLDPLSMPVRATSRAYRTNEVARERAHLDEAMGYLRMAPKSDAQSEPGLSEQGLTQSETDTVIARLALRKTLLGGLVGEHQAQRVGEQESAQNETIRSRNWDLLRGFAEKTGLLFEPLNVSGSSGEYAMLWFPADPDRAEPVGSPHGPVWKALNLRDPWTDRRLQKWEGPSFERAVDENGSLLPAGAAGARTVSLIPLAAYSLTYPKFPLLVIDFRDKLHLRRNEMTQRTVNELTSGIIGISHFTNWYYYAGASVYDFVASRHGKGMDAELRLDSYSQFRAALTLDNDLDPRMRALLQRRIDSVSVNPLEGSPEHDLLVADSQYDALLHEVSSGEMEKQLGKAREAELADFGKTQQVLAAQALVHSASFDLISPRSPKRTDVISELDRARRVQADLNVLHKASSSGPHPEIAYDAGRLRGTVQELSELLPGVHSKNIRTDVSSTLKQLNDLTGDRELQADCSLLLATLRKSEAPRGAEVAAAPRVVADALHQPQ